MSDIPGTKSPFLRVVPDDRAPAIIVSAYILVITSFVSTIARLTEVIARTRSFHLADGLLVAANARNALYTLDIQS